jgi:hypothetical protein
VRQAGLNGMMMHDETIATYDRGAAVSTIRR